MKIVKNVNVSDDDLSDGGEISFTAGKTFRFKDKFLSSFVVLGSYDEEKPYFIACSFEGQTFIRIVNYQNVCVEERGARYVQLETIHELEVAYILRWSDESFLTCCSGGFICYFKMDNGMKFSVEKAFEDPNLSFSTLIKLNDGEFLAMTENGPSKIINYHYKTTKDVDLFRRKEFILKKREICLSKKNDNCFFSLSKYSWPILYHFLDKTEFQISSLINYRTGQEVRVFNDVGSCEERYRTITKKVKVMETFVRKEAEILILGDKESLFFFDSRYSACCLWKVQLSKSYMTCSLLVVHRYLIFGDSEGDVRVYEINPSRTNQALKSHSDVADEVGEEENFSREYLEEESQFLLELKKCCHFFTNRYGATRISILDFTEDSIAVFVGSKLDSSITMGEICGINILPFTVSEVVGENNEEKRTHFLKKLILSYENQGRKERIYISEMLHVCLGKFILHLPKLLLY